MIRALGSILAIAAVLLALSCRENESSPPRASKSERALRVEILDVDAALRPRGDRPLIAGEALRLALRISGESPPYEVKVITSSGDPRLAEGTTRIGDAQSETPVESALELPLHREVPSGHYGLAVHVSSAKGAGLARSEPFEVVGTGAELLPEPAAPPFLEVVDVAGRRRKEFFAGESLRVRARFDGDTRVAVGIIADDDRPFMARASYQLDSGVLDMPLSIPRLARPGHYEVAVASKKHEVTSPLVVTGKPFPPAGKLGVDALTLYGGPDHRTRRKGILTRGEPLRIEARVAGAKKKVKLLVRLRTRTGSVASENDLAAVDVRDADPRARFFATGSWTVPSSLRPGRHTLEIEILEGDHVATLYREVLVR